MYGNFHEELTYKNEEIFDFLKNVKNLIVLSTWNLSELTWYGNLSYVH